MKNIGYLGSVLKYKLAVASLRKADDPLKLAHAVRHLGDAYNHGRQAELAEPCFVEALEIYRSNEHTRPLDLANTLRGFAVLKDYAGADEEARLLWHEAHDLYENLAVPAGVAESAARLALLAHRKHEVEQSRRWLDEAVAAADASNDPETLQYIDEARLQLETSNLKRETRQSS